MARSAKPRKAYRPRPVGRPIMERIRAELILPAYAGLTVLQTSGDQAACSDSMSMIVTLANYMSIAAPHAGLDGAPFEAAKHALIEIIERHTRAGVYRPTGPELIALRRAVVAADEMLPRLQTHHIEAALHAVAHQLGDLG